MGLFKDAAEHLGAVDHKLIASGELARGEVVSVHPTGMSWGGGEYGSSSSTTVCKITVNVIGLHGQPPYEASALAPIPDMNIPELELPGAAIAVRVNTADPHDIAFDLQHDVPDVPSAAGTPDASADAGIATEGGAQVILQSNDGTETALTTHLGTLTAAEVLAQGKPCTVDVLAIIPIDQKNAKGEDMTGLILNVHRSGQADVQAQIGTHVPPELAARVTVGATLPARYTPGLDTGDDTVVPDWSAISA
jgi:hypothetical protein